MVADKGLHPIDLLSEEFWQAVQTRVGWTQQAIAGPVPVGSRKASRQEQLRAFLEMAPEERIERSQTTDFRGVRRILFDLLGDHALNILPHMGVPMEPDEEVLQ